MGRAVASENYHLVGREEGMNRACLQLVLARLELDRRMVCVAIYWMRW